MAIAPRRAANPRHTWRSTGPRTASGKLRAARNALRHGLSVPVLADPVLEKEVLELAEGIAEGSTDPWIRELAVRVAEAQIDIQRARHVRRALTDGLLAELGSVPRKLREMVATSRYERRAMSRRKSAILAFNVERLLRVYADKCNRR